MNIPWLSKSVSYALDARVWVIRRRDSEIWDSYCEDILKRSGFEKEESSLKEDDKDSNFYGIQDLIEMLSKEREAVDKGVMTKDEILEQFNKLEKEVIEEREEQSSLWICLDGDADPMGYEAELKMLREDNNSGSEFVRQQKKELNVLRDGIRLAAIDLVKLAVRYGFTGDVKNDLDKVLVNLKSLLKPDSVQ